MNVQYTLSFEQYCALREAAAVLKTLAESMAKELPTFSVKAVAIADHALELSANVKPVHVVEA